jgi:outer membrane immunogenic protein
LRIGLFLRTVLLTIAFSSAADASDLIAGPARDPARDEEPSWTGIYMGGGIGAASFNSRWQTDCLASVALPAGCPNDIFGGATRVGNDNPAHFDSSGMRLNLYLGLDWQLSKRFVVGLEGEAALLDADRTRAGIPGAWSTDFGPGSNSASIKDHWDASLRARVGFLLTPRTLVYSTGGLAILREEVRATCEGSFPVGWCAAPNSDSESATLYGWTAGGGVERMIGPAWILRGEYRYSDYGISSFTLFDDASLDSVNISIEQKGSIAYVGLSRRF